MQVIRQPRHDVAARPFLVIWETTQACDLACRHCRAQATPEHDPLALSYAEACRLIDQIGDFGLPHPLFILTGGDPFKRADIFDLVRYAGSKGLPAAVSPSGTPLLTSDNLARLKDAGARAISLSVDASHAAIHDEFRRVPGSFQWTINGWKAAHEQGLKVQINSTVTRYNLHDLPNLFALVRDMGAMTWSVFFLIPTGRALADDNISPDDYEAVMNFLYDASKYISLKTTEGHHYKRIALQRSVLEARGLPLDGYMHLNSTYQSLLAGLRTVTGTHAAPPAERMRRAPMHVNSAEGFVFVSLRGDVFPSGYLPLSAGNVRETSLIDIYQHSRLFTTLRHKANLKGRCGQCEFNWICGGSRSRAFAVTGDVFSEDPFCTYVPGSFPFMDDVRLLVRNTEQAAAPRPEASAR